MTSNSEIVFKDNRLKVGYRRRDMHWVWYEPVGGKEAAGQVMIGLFTDSKGEAGDEEPMEAEVKWNAHFDLEDMPAKGKTAQRILQSRFIHDAWCFLSTKTEDDMLRQEEELTRLEGYMLWETWFVEAKKYQSHKLRARAQRRAKRRDAIIAAGEDPNLVNYNSDSSEDEAYSSGTSRARRAKTDMRPPPGPLNNNGGGPQKGNKRKAPPANRPPRPTKKQTKKPPNGKGKGRAGVGIPAMSGGLGAGDDPSDWTGMRRSTTPPSDLDDDDGQRSVAWDGREPEVPPFGSRASVYNGTEDEEEAFQQAVRRSVAPETQTQTTPGVPEMQSPGAPGPGDLALPTPRSQH